MPTRDPRCIDRHVPNCSCEGEARWPIVLGQLMQHVQPAPAPAPLVQPQPPAKPWPREMPLRFLRDVGTIASVYTYWHTEGGCDGCTSLYHSAMCEFARSDKLGDAEIGGADDAIPTDNLPSTCDRCGAKRPEHEVDRKIFREPWRVAPDGKTVVKPEPGDCFFAVHEYTCCPWDNCDGFHLVVVCPDGCHWDTGSRANNCTMKEDKTHRCWVIHGDPRKGELPTSDKNGHTCQAGAGSIQTSRYHGMLTNGILREC